MIKEFQGKYRFLSNFWPAEVDYNGYLFPSVEHAYQAAKTFDEDAQVEIAEMTAGQAKRRGKTVTMRPDWDKIKTSVMFSLLRKKFSKEPLRGSLLATGEQQLEEGNYWGDTFWGVCKGKGENHLGKLLMRVREELRPPSEAA